MAPTHAHADTCMHTHVAQSAGRLVVVLHKLRLFAQGAQPTILLVQEGCLLAQREPSSCCSSCHHSVCVCARVCVRVRAEMDFHLQCVSYVKACVFISLPHCLFPSITLLTPPSVSVSPLTTAWVSGHFVSVCLFVIVYPLFSSSKN